AKAGFDYRTHICGAPDELCQRGYFVVDYVHGHSPCRILGCVTATAAGMALGNTHTNAYGIGGVSNNQQDPRGRASWSARQTTDATRPRSPRGSEATGDRPVQQ